jgi:hypothetical protein
MSTEATTAAAAAFRTSMQQRDFTAAAGTLADDVAFRSPVLDEPWRTKAVVRRLGPAMVSVLDDTRVTGEVTNEDRAILTFTARCGGTYVEGVEILDLDADGKVADMAILIRPLSALHAVAKAMARAVDPALLSEHAAT